MEIRFTRLAGDRCEITVSGRRGADVRMPDALVMQGIPHDLVHAAVERELGLQDGFWDAVAKGATFDGFEFTEPRRHRKAGMKVLRRDGDRVMAAEHKVIWAYRAWRGLPRTGTGPSPLTDAETTRACRAIDEAAEQWAKTPEGHDLVWRW